MFRANKVKQSLDFMKSEGAARGTTTAKGVPSIISVDLSVKGDIYSNGEVQIDGMVEGDVQCQTMTVGMGGSVTGEVSAEAVRVYGKITGQIRAKTVFLAATGRVVGDVSHESLAVEPGAYIEGLCKRLTPNVPELTTTPTFSLSKGFAAETESVGGNGGAVNWPAAEKEVRESSTTTF